MTEYEYVSKRISPSGAHPDLEETVEVPDDAIGVTLSTWGSPESEHDENAWVRVKYLVPAKRADGPPETWVPGIEEAREQVGESDER